MHDIPFKVQERSIDFNAIDYKKFINMVSGFTFQITFRNYHLLIFGDYQKRISTII